MTPQLNGDCLERVLWASVPYYGFDSAVAWKMSMLQLWLECWGSFFLDHLAEDSEKHVRHLGMKGLVQDVTIPPPPGGGEFPNEKVGDACQKI